jgi:hypothetical protein
MTDRAPRVPRRTAPRKRVVSPAVQAALDRRKAAAAADRSPPRRPVPAHPQTAPAVATLKRTHAHDDSAPRVPLPSFDDNAQRAFDLVVKTYSEGLPAGVADQTVDVATEAIARALDGQWNGDISAAFNAVANILDGLRDVAHQSLGELALAVGRSVGLPEWAAVLGARLVVSVTSLPFEMQLQAGAIAIRVAGACLQAELDAPDDDVVSYDPVTHLADQLSSAWAPLFAIPAPEVAAQVPEEPTPRPHENGPAIGVLREATPPPPAPETPAIGVIDTVAAPPRPPLDRAESLSLLDEAEPAPSLLHPDEAEPAPSLLHPDEDEPSVTREVEQPEVDDDLELWTDPFR